MSDSALTPQENGTDPAKPTTAFSLENILGDEHESIEHTTINGELPAPTGWDEETTESSATEGFCIECEGMSSLEIEYDAQTN
jgi:hypothetical protein